MTKFPIHLEARKSNGQRKLSPTAARNKMPIAKAMLPFIPDQARILEIAAGTGEHALHMCQMRPDIFWQPSDPDVASRESQAAWGEDCRDQIASPLDIDLLKPEWALPFAGAIKPEFEAIFCANMIHIAPWEATLALAEGAQIILRKGGRVILYGPFLEGETTAPSNLAFDNTLKMRNPAWGVRDLKSVKHIFADAGFNVLARIEMPKDNRVIIFEKSS